MVGRQLCCVFARCFGDDEKKTEKTFETFVHVFILIKIFLAYCHLFARKTTVTSDHDGETRDERCGAG